MQMLKRIKILICAILNDIRGEYTFSVNGHEITAIFLEKCNNDLVNRLREILFGCSHIRQNALDQGKIEKKIREMV